MPVDFSSNQSGQGSMPTGGLPGTVTPKQASDDAAGLKAMLVDYNKRFMSAAPAKYRDHEVFQVLSQLTMLQKSCSLLVGAPGVGKTKIAYPPRGGACLARPARIMRDTYVRVAYLYIVS